MPAANNAPSYPPQPATFARAPLSHPLCSPAIWAAVAALLEGLFFWLLVPWFVTGPITDVSADVEYARLLIHVYILLLCTFAACFAAAPAAASLVASLRPRLPKQVSVITCAALCCALAVFVVHAGRSQFGAFDYNVLIDTGWRQMQGQRPYVDFLTTTPPGFNLGIRFAYQIFGVTWDAGLYAAALCACLTYLWIVWLLTQLSLSRPAAMLLALAIEASAILVLCFWWYNDSAMILATVFLLSCMLCARQTDRVKPLTQASYVLSLAFLALMKPNVAGVAILGGVLLLFFATHQKLRILLLTLAAGAFSFLILTLTHTSVPAMLAAYQAAARERGGFNTFGFDQMNNLQLTEVATWGALLAIPLLWHLPHIFRQFRNRAWTAAAAGLLPWVAVVVAIYALATNGEFREAEWAILMAAGGVVAFGLGTSRPLVRRIYIALLCAATVSNLYLGFARARVFTIGPHLFFEWSDHDHLVTSGFLKNMRISSSLVDVERDIDLARSNNTGPFFFGPRLEFNYAALRLPSPTGLPAWWHPGTSFARAEEPRLIQAWQDHRFKTLVFLKGDYTYYPPALLDAIHTLYQQDDRYPSLTVYHRRSIAANPVATPPQ